MIKKTIADSVKFSNVYISFTHYRFYDDTILKHKQLKRGYQDGVWKFTPIKIHYENVNNRIEYLESANFEFNQAKTQLNSHTFLSCLGKGERFTVSGI